MEVLLKCAAVCLFSAVTGLLIRRKNPELSFLLSVAAVAAVLMAGLSLFDYLLNLMRQQAQAFGIAPEVLRPVLKCLGIALVGRAGADLCRDASQTALAGALELTAGLCAAAVAAPIIVEVMNIIGGML